MCCLEFVVEEAEFSDKDAEFGLERPAWFAQTNIKPENFYA
jgi:hypothetical protein